MEDSAIHLFWGRYIISKSGAKLFQENLLLLPGDSVFLDENFKISFSNGYPKYIDSLISIPDNIYNSKTNGLNINSSATRKQLEYVSSQYLRNHKEITSLNISDKQRKMLYVFNLLIKDIQLSKFLSDTIKIQKSISDSISNELKKDIPIISIINSQFVNGIIYENIIRTASKSSIKSSNIWECFLKVDTNTQNSMAYTKFAFWNLGNEFINQFNLLDSVHLKLQNNPIRTSLIDSLTKLSKILLSTYTNYNKAKQDLQSFDNGKYIFLFAEDNRPNHEPRNISMTADETVYKFDNSTTTFKQELFRDTANYKYFFIDFWASWCVPCVSDYPHLKKYEDRYKNASIKFISISMDVKPNMQQWINKTKQLGNYDKPNNFIIDSSFNSHIAKFFNINSIPRYIVIDKKGNIVDEDFAHPQDDNFELKLTQLINK
ncbi:MAG: TlpA disulfide reductase family protein [Arachidicoccus sp.]|nr:TlpA disulfide reductase family protein [Arachidicoccus sp.]